MAWEHVKSAEVLPTSKTKKVITKKSSVGPTRHVEVGTETADFNVPLLPRLKLPRRLRRVLFADGCWC